MDKQKQQFGDKKTVPAQKQMRKMQQKKSISSKKSPLSGIFRIFVSINIRSHLNRKKV
jgi:hypothetical protein